MAAGSGGAGVGAGGLTLGTSGAEHNGVLQDVTVLIFKLLVQEPHDLSLTNFDPDISLGPSCFRAPLRITSVKLVKQFLVDMWKSVVQL